MAAARADGRIGAVPGPALAGLGLPAVAANLAATGAAPAALAGAGLLAAVVVLADLRLAPRRPADAIDWSLFAAALALAAMPVRSLALVALLPLAGIALRSGGTPGRGAALLLATLAVAGLAGGPAASFLAPPVLATEARLVGWLLLPFGIASEAADNTLHLAGPDRMLVILRGCSLLELLPPLVPVMLALARLMAPARHLAFARLLAAGGIAVLLNLARLAAMAVSGDAATFFHSSLGSTLLQTAWLGLALAAAWPRGGDSP